MRSPDELSFRLGMGSLRRVVEGGPRKAKMICQASFWQNFPEYPTFFFFSGRVSFEFLTPFGTKIWIGHAKSTGSSS